MEVKVVWPQSWEFGFVVYMMPALENGKNDHIQPGAVKLVLCGHWMHLSTCISDVREPISLHQTVWSKERFSQCSHERHYLLSNIWVRVTFNIFCETPAPNRKKSNGCADNFVLSCLKWRERTNFFGENFVFSLQNFCWNLFSFCRKFQENNKKRSKGLQRLRRNLAWNLIKYFFSKFNMPNQWN